MQTTMGFRGRRPLLYALSALVTTVTVASFVTLSPLSAEAQPAQTPAKNKAKPPVKKPKANKPIPGGANQVEGLNGKVGQMLFDGKWRFQVQSVEEGLTSYTLKVPSSEQDYRRFSSAAEEDMTTHTFKPRAGNSLVAIKCLVKNGQNKVQQLDFYLHDPRTALADDQGNSYPPIVYDMVSKGAWVTKPLLPGAGQEITVLFAVPTGTKLKDLVFTLKNWVDSKGRDVRVSLAPTP